MVYIYVYHITIQVTELRLINHIKNIWGGSSHILANDDLVIWFLDHGADPNLGPPILQPQPAAAPIKLLGKVLDIAASAASVATFDALLRHGAKIESSLPLHS